MQSLPLNQLISLEELEEGHCGVVEKVSADDADLARLMAMGVCAGRKVELIQHGDPLILKVYGSRIGISRRLAERIMVSSCGSGSCPIA